MWNEDITFSAAEMIESVLRCQRPYVALDMLEAAEVEIITHRYTEKTEPIIQIIVGVPTGQALEAIRLARKMIQTTYWICHLGRFQGLSVFPIQGDRS